MNTKKVVLAACILVLFAVVVGLVISINNQLNTTESDNDKIVLYDYIYKNNKDTEVKKYLYVPKEQSIETDIVLILQHLENAVFDGNRLDYSYDSVQERVTVFFSDDKANTIYESKWNNYFQGSSGAAYTEKMLVNNILQFEREGRWIKEVSFQYNNTQFPAMDHIDISLPISRENK